jgi:hypothetical protein
VDKADLSGQTDLRVLQMTEPLVDEGTLEALRKLLPQHWRKLLLSLPNLRWLQLEGLRGRAQSLTLQVPSSYPPVLILSRTS